jgi:DNA-binding MarR family transcriptional regulator
MEPSRQTSKETAVKPTSKKTAAALAAKQAAKAAPVPRKVKSPPVSSTPAKRPTTASFRRIHDLAVKLVGNTLAELSMRQLAVFTAIRIGDVAPGVRELSTSLSINKPSVTRAMDSLETQGLIKRYADEQDRRLVVASLSPKGDELAALLESV